MNGAGYHPLRKLTKLSLVRCSAVYGRLSVSLPELCLPPQHLSQGLETDVQFF